MTNLESNKDMAYLIFDGNRLVAQGSVDDISTTLRANTRKLEDILNLLVFDYRTGRQVDLDARALLDRDSGDEIEVASTHRAVGQPVDSQANSDEPEEDEQLKKTRGRGRPRLGVKGREVTLLPRHWDWLEQQRGGASAALRRLVEEARKKSVEELGQREAQDATQRFMYAMAGDLPGFEEAVRSLYSGNRGRFEEMVASWPEDIRFAVGHYAVSAFG